MSQILNLSQHTTDAELQRLTTLLLFHLVENRIPATSFYVGRA